MERSKIHEEINEALPHIPVEAIAAYDDNQHGHMTADDLRDEIDEAWAGEWEDLADYAYNLAEECGDLEANPGRDGQARWPFYCIDWDRAGRELEIGGDIWCERAKEGGIYVFRNL